MNMRVTGSYPAGLTSPVDKRIGDAFPIIEAVYKELGKLKYIAEHSDKFAKRDVELRANMDLRAIEWRYKDQDEWLLMITFSDLVQVDLLTFEQDLHAAVAEAQDWANHAREVTADVDKIIAETHQARDQAVAAASSIGIFRVFKTKAEAEANTVAVPVGKYIEVLADESYNGYRTRYEKTINGYEFAVNLDAAIESALNQLPSATPSSDGFMSGADKTKLDGIADGANNYIHPASHPPSIIAQDASNRFVTDAEKSTWGGKAEGTHSHTIADLPVATSGSTSATQLVRADDLRLSNSRTPTAHTHSAADVGLDKVNNTADSDKSVASATKLTTARTINGVSFDGTANITVVDSTKLPLTGGSINVDVLVTGGGAFGYGAGAGGSVTQVTSKSTAVTLNKPVGYIVMNGASLAAGASVSFRVNNSTVASGDAVIAQISWSVPDGINYRLEEVHAGAGAFLLRVTNISAAPLSDALVIEFVTIKGGRA